jgi:hypothetical protein
MQKYSSMDIYVFFQVYVTVRGSAKPNRCLFRSFVR